MLKVEKQGKPGQLKKRLEELLSSNAVRPPLTDALRDVLAAINYADNVLLEASTNALFAALAGAAQDIIRVELARSEATKKAIQQVWQEVVDGHACDEDFDDLKDVFESLIDENIAKMTARQNDLVMVLEQRDCAVANAQQLQDGIRSMRKFRENILKEWPSSGKPPAPIDREAIAEARKAIAGGYKGLSKDQLVWGNDSSKKGNE